GTEGSRRQVPPTATGQRRSVQPGPAAAAADVGGGEAPAGVDENIHRGRVEVQAQALPAGAHARVHRSRCGARRGTSGGTWLSPDERRVSEARCRDGGGGTEAGRQD